MSDGANIIQFPKQQQSGGSVPPTPPPKKTRKLNVSLATTLCSMCAIALAVVTSNGSFFKKADGSLDLASHADGRVIASVEVESLEPRDAAWEKSVAESLASAEIRDVASISVGHEASVDENLRFGLLERKYTILRDLQRNEIESIILQGNNSEPSLVANRTQFLKTYGKFLSEKYSFAELKSSERVKDRRLESYTLFDSGRNAYGLARFELDNFQRLIAFHLERL